MADRFTQTLALSLCLALATILSGCGNGSGSVARYSVPPRSMGPEMIFKKLEAPRDLRMFDGAQRAPIIWEDLVNAMLWAEVVVVGADAGDDTSTSVVNAVVSDAVTPWPWTRVSLGDVGRGEAVTTSAHGEVVSIARAAGAQTMAANAPRALRDRWADGDRAMLKDKAERDLVSAPLRPQSQGLRGVEAARALAAATVADTITEALKKSRNPRVVHVADLFHGDVPGGLTGEIAARRPGTKVLTIAVVRQKSDTLRANDLNRADIVVYTNE